MEKLIFEKTSPGRIGYTLPKLDVPEVPLDSALPSDMIRKESAPLPEISEIEIARHFQRLSHLNFNIEKGMYPLGSCTMKYNPKVNEKTAAMPGFGELHPLTEDKYAQGALQLMFELGEMLKELTGMPGVSLQPVAGSQGELTGILMIRKYHLERGDVNRKVILIPEAAHGTNPASAAIGGFKIVSVKNNADGRTDLEDLKSKCTDEVAGFMLTNPNTVGLFESDIIEIQKAIHDCGGLMYMDGANLNALIGLVRPGDMKFDCVHINLHKTFSTPHGGGGPGAGPVCVSDKLVPYLPNPQVKFDGENYTLDSSNEKSIGKVHSFNGNFGVLVRAYTYMRMNGAVGIRNISTNAIINANYILSQLKDNYLAPYTEFCMHECIFSADHQKKHGVSARDIAKRLLDYGFHAPTVYFPLVVREAMLIEPTETENLQNLQGFIDAMNAIAEETRTNPELVQKAPHTAPIRRLDEALANRKLNLKWGDE